MSKKIIFTLFFISTISMSVWLYRRYQIGLPRVSPGQKVIFDNNTQPSQTTPEVVGYNVEEVVRGLFVPWSIVFTSADRMLITERSGAIRVVSSGVLQEKPLINFPEVSTRSEEGLMGMTLHPNYSANKRLYVCLAYLSSTGLVDKVVELEDMGDAISIIKTVIDSLPAATNHAGCRLKFGPDQKLYITTGDATDKEIAQDRSSLGGKILRVNDDGSIPNDNPFPNSPIWSLGHRNPQGIAWHPVTGQLVATEHGPSGFDGPGGGDEVNAIIKGGNYGWPIVSHEKTDQRFVSPLLVFTPAEAPAGATFYDGTIFPQFKHNFFFGALRGEGIMRVVFDESDVNKVSSYEKLSGIDVGRIRDIVTGPDGYIYFSTSNRDGRGTLREGDDKIYRLTRFDD